MGILRLQIKSTARRHRRIDAAACCKDGDGPSQDIFGASGILASISECSKRAELGIDVSVPSVFEILYPQVDYSVFATEGFEGLGRQERIRREKARGLAAELEPHGPGRAISMVLKASRQAAEVNKSQPDMTGEVAAEIARRTSDPYAWAEQAIDGGLSADVVAPLLRAARTKDRDFGTTYVIGALKSEQAQGAGVSVVLTATHPVEVELEAALGVASRFPGLIGGLILRKEIPKLTIRWLLNHPSPDVAEATAVSLWIHYRESLVPEDLFEDWRESMLRAPAEHGMISVVFESEAWLFAEWLVRYLGSDPKRLSYRTENDLERAFERLSTEQRIAILETIQKADAVCLAWVIGRLVRDDAAVFRRLLAMDELASLYEAGFACSVSEEKIKAVCDVGWGSERIAQSIVSPIGIVFSWSGDESEHWAKRRECLAWIAKSDDPRIAAVGRAIHEYVQRKIDDALGRERDRGVYGL